MKKLVFCFVLLLVIVFANFSFGQSSYENCRAAQTTQRIVKMNRLANPDVIFPNQELMLPVPGLSYPVYYDVTPGDCLWWISKRVNRGDFSPVQRIEPAKPVVEENPQNADSQLKVIDFIRNNFWWLIIALVVVTFIVYKIVTEEQTKDIDPVTAGTPQVPGGVNDHNAYNRMSELAIARFPSATLVIKNIRRGHISGAGEIYYAGSAKPKKINMNNIPAYAGEILVNSKEQTIYFLQGCGNDARQGNFMYGDKFVFTPDVLINPDGSERPLSQEQGEDSVAPVQISPKEEVKQEEPKPVETPVESELYRTISSHILLADEFLKTQTAHKVTLKVTTPQGTVETVLETKTGTQQQKTEEKKN